MRLAQTKGPWRGVLLLLGLTLALAACNARQTVDEPAEDADATATEPPIPTVAPSTPAEDPSPPAVEVEPVPFVPFGRVGDADAYDNLIQSLQDELDPEYWGDIPWPDLGNPDPVVAQTQIFALWIWMDENYPDPLLVPIMAAPGSPSEVEIGQVFRQKWNDGTLQVRNGDPYRAFDHRVVTFESAGLPLWLGRDVPEDAVVVYYEDNAGPVQVLDRATREFQFSMPATPTRRWLSIMVPTDVGWQLWRDQLIEPGDPELEVPEFAPPSAESAPRKQDL